MKKKSNKQFEEQLKKIKPNLLALSEYQNKDTEINVKCKICGRTWSETPRSLLRTSKGTGCKNCSKKIRNPYTRRSKEQLQKELDDKKSCIKILGDYKGMTKPLEVKCEICGRIWNARPDHLTEGHGCARCHGSEQKTNEIFLSQLKKVNKYIEVLEEYKNCKEKLSCRCKVCGHEWKPSPEKLLCGNGCPRCDSRNKTSFSEQTVLFYVRKQNPDTCSRYKIDDSKLELDIFIPSKSLAIEYDGLFWHRGKNELEKLKYELCRERGIKLIRIREGGVSTDDADFVINRNAPYNYKTLDEVVIRLFEYLNFKEYEIDSEKDAYIIREQFYSELKHNSLAKKNPSLSKEWLQSKNKGITPYMVSAGCNDRYWWKCSVCGHEWKAAVCDRSLAGKGCKKCANRKLSELHLKSQADFEEDIKQICPNIIISGKYIGYQENITVKCKKCGNIWDTKPATLYRGRQCQKCDAVIASSKKKTNEEFLSEMAQLQPNLVFYDEYKGRQQKMRAVCKICNKELFPRPSDLLHGHYRIHLHKER